MNNQIGLHTGYWQGSEISNQMQVIVDFTKKSGADIIELSMGSLVQLSAAESLSLREYIENQGLKIRINGGLVTIDNDISSPDAASRARGLEHCKKMLQICASFGSPTWSGLIHSAWLLRPDPLDPIADKNERKLRAIEGMKRVSAFAEALEVVCCLEIVNRYEQFVFNTVAEGLEFCEAVGSPSCSLLLDTYHMAIEENNISESIMLAQAAERIAYIHIGESNRRVPMNNSGNINWAAVSTAIKSSEYKGPLVLEPLELRTSPAATKMCIWRSFVTENETIELLDRAKKGVAFLRKL